MPAIKELERNIECCRREIRNLVVMGMNPSQTPDQLELIRNLERSARADGNSKAGPTSSRPRPRNDPPCAVFALGQASPWPGPFFLARRTWLVAGTEGLLRYSVSLSPLHNCHRSTKLVAMLSNEIAANYLLHSF